MVAFEHHTHYTGSLPLDFIWSQIKKNPNILSQHLEIWNKLFPDVNVKKWENSNDKLRVDYYTSFKSNLASIFSADWKNNQLLFDSIYRFFQSFTKGTNLNESARLYFLGTQALAKSFVDEGIKSFEVKAGSCSNIEETENRIRNMHAGFDLFEKQNDFHNLAKITLTFIKSEGKFINFYWDTFYKILKLIETDIGVRVNGFDFSGEESITEPETLISIVKEIKKYNLNRKRRSLNPLIISVHAGENFNNLNSNYYLSYFEKLFKTGVDRIGHGTFLWIPANLIGIDKNIDNKRKLILKKYAQKGIEFEICPTSNTLLTPLISKQCIPYNYFSEIGLKYSINTDNKTIFSTTIQKELNSYID